MRREPGHHGWKARPPKGRAGSAGGGAKRSSAPSTYLSARRRTEGGVDDELNISQHEYLALDDEKAALLINARYEALRALGCDAEAAVVVAVFPEIDIDAALELIEGGIDPPTVVRVLSA